MVHHGKPKVQPISGARCKNFVFFLYFYMVELQGAEKPIFAIIDTM